MKAPETRSRAHASTDDEKAGTRKAKKTKTENEEENSHNGTHTNGKSEADVMEEFEEFCKVTMEKLTTELVKELLEVNDQDISGVDEEDVLRCQDMLFFGVMEKCPVCGAGLAHCDGREYSCRGTYSEWSTCTFRTRDPERKEEKVKLTDAIENSDFADLIKSCLSQKRRPHRKLDLVDKPFIGMTISLSGRLSRTHQYWKREIEKHGGKFSNSVADATCVVVSATERNRGGSSKITDAMERQIPVVREAWLQDSIEKQEPQPLEAYDVLSDRSVDGKGIPWDKQDPSEEALESFSAELKLTGKRGVYKDTRLEGGKIFEKDGIIFNCAFSLCDLGRGVNDYCIMQLVMAPENRLHLYYKKGRVGDDPGAEERLEEWENVDDAIKEFVQLFEELTGNEFEPWEREKIFQKKSLKFYPIDMDEGVDVRYGGLGLRQLGVAAAHCKLEPHAASFMKVLCGQEIYKYALMEMGLDPPDLPMGMLSQIHLKRCEEILLEFIKTMESVEETGVKAKALWVDFSNKWFTLMHSTRPFIFRDYQEIADHAAASLETVRDITVASHLVGDLTGGTVGDPLSDRYKKLGCPINLVDKESEDYKMILNYLEKTYEPVKVGEISYGISVDNVFAVEPKAGPSYNEIKKLPNKVLLWCGTRSSNLLRHLKKGFMPAICSLPVSGYMFGRAIVCSDAAAEAARYGFTAVDRPEGFLVLAVASLGEEIVEVTSPPQDTDSLEEKKVGVKGMGRKTTDEKEHVIWKDDIKVPCGRLIPSKHKDSPLEYNEYAAYDPKQVSIRFLVAVKFEEKGVVMDTED